MYSLFKSLFGSPAFAPNDEFKEPSIESEVLITKKDLILTQGTNTFNNAFKPKKSLSLHHIKRNEFFAQHVDAKALLLNQKENPLIEEGRISRSKKRKREGELFITCDAFRILVNEIFKDYLTKKKLFIAASNKELSNIFGKLQLQHGEEAVMVLFDEVHATTLFAKQFHDVIKFFIVETTCEEEHEPNYIIRMVRNKFERSGIILNSTSLQIDYYSCTTFAIQVMRYLLKHGEEVFPYLESKLIINYDLAQWEYYLPKDKLMPALLKLSQTQMKLPNDVLDTVVSHKKNLTLRQYWEKHQLKMDGKWINSAAFMKRYKYIEKLDSILKARKEEERAKQLRIEETVDKQDSPRSPNYANR